MAFSTRSLQTIGAAGLLVALSACDDSSSHRHDTAGTQTLTNETVAVQTLQLLEIADAYGELGYYMRYIQGAETHVDCANGGTLAMYWTDADDSDDLSVNDGVELVFDDCTMPHQSRIRLEGFVQLTLVESDMLPLWGGHIDDGGVDANGVPLPPADDQSAGEFLPPLLRSDGEPLAVAPVMPTSTVWYFPADFIMMGISPYHGNSIVDVETSSLSVYLPGQEQIIVLTGALRAEHPVEYFHRQYTTVEEKALTMDLGADTFAIDTLSIIHETGELVDDTVQVQVNTPSRLVHISGDVHNIRADHHFRFNTDPEQGGSPFHSAGDGYPGRGELVFSEPEVFSLSAVTPAYTASGGHVYEWPPYPLPHVATDDSDSSAGFATDTKQYVVPQLPVKPMHFEIIEDETDPLIVYYDNVISGWLFDDSQIPAAGIEMTGEWVYYNGDAQEKRRLQLTESGFVLWQHEADVLGDDAGLERPSRDGVVIRGTYSREADGDIVLQAETGLRCDKGGVWVQATLSEDDVEHNVFLPRFYWSSALHPYENVAYFVPRDNVYNSLGITDRPFFRESEPLDRPYPGAGDGCQP